MATMTNNMPTTKAEGPPASSPRSKASAASASVMLPWLRAQAINVTRHAAALRPFKVDEFGTGSAAPTAGHIQAVNSLITKLRSGLLHMSGKVTKSAKATMQEPSTAALQDLMYKKSKHITGSAELKRSGIFILNFLANASLVMQNGC